LVSTMSFIAVERFELLQLEFITGIAIEFCSSYKVRCKIWFGFLLKLFSELVFESFRAYFCQVLHLLRLKK